MAKKQRAVVKSIARRQELKRWRRRLRQRRAKEHRRATRHFSSATPPSYKERQRSIGKRSPPLVVLIVPLVLDLSRNHGATCKFVHEVRVAARAGNNVALDFGKTTRIHQSALVYLLGCIHKLRMEYGERCVTGTYPENRNVDRLLTQSGFYSMLGVRSRIEGLAPSRTRRYIRFKSDQRINAPLIANLRGELLREDLSMPPPIARVVFRALSEAMTNVNHHAYIQKGFSSPSAAKKLFGRWWMVASLNVTRNMFTLAFYDSGVGIPKTLPRQYTWEQIRGVLHRLPLPGFYPDDGEMIDAAMKLGRSRTGLGNRGKGLMDLAKLIDVIGGGEMRILSRHGAYSYTANGEISVLNGVGFLEGTLIEWQLPIDKALGVLPEDIHEQITT